MDEHPSVADYVQLFRTYGHDLGGIYADDNDVRYAFLFEQVVRLLIRPSHFNLALPLEFRQVAQRYHAGDADTLAHLREPVNRNFMLCDLHDLVMLKGGLRLRRAEQSHE
jgi:hypothetical protein